MLRTTTQTTNGVRVSVEKEDDLVCTETSGLTINTTSVSTTVSSRRTYSSLSYSNVLAKIEHFIRVQVQMS